MPSVRSGARSSRRRTSRRTDFRGIATRANRKIGRARHRCVRLAAAATDDRTMKAALQNHHARMQRVLDYIDRHLDDDLDLDALSRVAAYSKYHFHRQFTATFGLS